MLRFISTLSAALLIVATATAQEVKNIIYLIGDGMSLSAVTMMELEDNDEETIFDRAENIALQKSWSLDNRVTDSAAAGTALATGHKTNNTMLGMLPDGSSVESLMELASEHGMATGLVVTTTIQHATPAAFYAHIASRHEYSEIARQLLASQIDLAIGGGMSHFDALYEGRDMALQAIAEAGFTFHDELSDGTWSGDERHMAILSDGEVQERSDYLREATERAIATLEAQGGDNGFVLMVEGSLIDGMAHGNDAEAMKCEMADFMAAAEAAVAYAERTPGTLVVITGDHETGGLSIVSCDADFCLSEQGIEYRWGTRGHSAQMVPIYLYGTGAELINGIMENAELGQRLKSLIE